MTNTTIKNFTYAGATYYYDEKKHGYYQKIDEVAKKISKEEYLNTLEEYSNQPEPEPETPAPKKVAHKSALTLPLVWTNTTDKKGRMIYKVNDTAVFIVERINKSRKASVYLHERLNSTLGEPNGNKTSKYSRRIRGPIDEAIRQADEAAHAWAALEIAKAEETENA